MNSRFQLFAWLFLVLISRLGHAQGTFIIQHNGASNPTSEGFSLTTQGFQTFVGPVSGSGVSAWNTTISNLSGIIYYTYSLTPQQQAETIGTDWILSFNLQLPNPNSQAGVGVDTFGITVASGNNGDPFVPGGFTLTGGGAGYHNYQVYYSSAAGTASIWVDGIERAHDYLYGISLPNGLSELQWGVGQGGPSSANWSTVSLQIVPEPSALSLVLLASGGLIFIRYRKRHSPQV